MDGGGATKSALPRADWRRTVDGTAATPIAWNWNTLVESRAIADVSDVHCVTQLLRYDNHRQGISTAHLLSVVQPLQNAAVVALHAYDSYTTNDRLDHSAPAACLLANRHDGAPISREHGGPVRAIIPRYQQWKSVKWLKRIEVLPADRPGCRETRGHHNEGDPWTEQRHG